MDIPNFGPMNQSILWHWRCIYVDKVLLYLKSRRIRTLSLHISRRETLNRGTHGMSCMFPFQLSFSFTISSHGLSLFGLISWYLYSSQLAGSTISWLQPFSIWILVFLIYLWVCHGPELFSVGFRRTGIPCQLLLYWKSETSFKYS